MTTESMFRLIAIAKIALCLPIGLYTDSSPRRAGNLWPAGKRASPSWLASGCAAPWPGLYSPPT